MSKSTVDRGRADSPDELDKELDWLIENESSDVSLPSTDLYILLNFTSIRIV
jgi:hypothetical protein